jgi:hypothetical protein
MLTASPYMLQEDIVNTQRTIGGDEADNGDNVALGAAAARTWSQQNVGHPSDDQHGGDANKMHIAKQIELELRRREESDNTEHSADVESQVKADTVGLVRDEQQQQTRDSSPDVSNNVKPAMMNSKDVSQMGAIRSGKRLREGESDGGRRDIILELHNKIKKRNELKAQQDRLEHERAKAELQQALQAASPAIHEDTQATTSPVDGRAAKLTWSEGVQGQVTRYLDTRPLTPGFPIVVLCYNRPEYLRETLKSLVEVRGVLRSDILVSQDEDDAAVAAVVQEFNLMHVQREQLEPFPVDPQTGEVDGGMRIAVHYKFSLQQAFMHFRSAPGVVVVEDDFRVSPDFMEFFCAVGPAVETDPTLWIASAWNDNGFKGKLVW